ncbi:unnamed protein product [Paramecium pentaurelia]|uniref:Uncharacterized protein n=1 Tax=Paramecium pentaurelia TaxID=43138 RepID=A0A8S1Y7C9_9CILI|nr:unnamed protein product [Paramecium pentaurelia]
MKYIAILLLVLVLTNGANIRKHKQNKGTKHTQDLVQIESENVGNSYDLSNNVGVISSQEMVVNALTNQDRIEKAESKERNAIHNALNKSHKSFVQVSDNENQVYVEETLDQTPKKEINFADLFTNDGSSPDMGKQALIEDSPSPPMVYIQQDDNLDYVRAIDKLDLLDENGQPLQLLPEELSLLEMSQFESRFQQTETPQMEQAPSWNLETAYEKTPGQSELSPEELQRQTDQMVDSLRGELENEDI